jgi:hypothetical protein
VSWSPLGRHGDREETDSSHDWTDQFSRPKRLHNSWAALMPSIGRECQMLSPRSDEHDPPRAISWMCEDADDLKPDGSFSSLAVKAESSGAMM